MILVRDIKAEVAEVIGQCDDNALVYQSITRAIELLGNKRLIDPLKRYLDINVGAALFHIALPREIKTPIQVNINTNPAFARGQLFEFLQNTDGSATGEQLGFQWSDRGYQPIQFPGQLPGVLNYLGSNVADNGKTIAVTGRDANGVMQTEVLVSSSTTPTAGSIVFHTIEEVLREETQFYSTLRKVTDTVAIYQPVEVAPMYRFIRLSKAAAAIRMIYRAETFAVTSDDDLIPCNSPLAMIHACRAVRWYANDDYIRGNLALAAATQFLNEEQNARELNLQVAAITQAESAINADMWVADGIIVRDLYDIASGIFGPIGRAKLLDQIEIGVEILRNKAHWQSDLGVVDIIAAGDGAWTQSPCDCSLTAVQEGDPQASSDSKSGRQAINAEVNFVDVVFATPYAEGVEPTIGGCLIQRTDENDPNVLVSGLGPVTNEGFRVYLSATVHTANYILHWESSI